MIEGIPISSLLQVLSADSQRDTDNERKVGRKPFQGSKSIHLGHVSSSWKCSHLCRVWKKRPNKTHVSPTPYHKQTWHFSRAKVSKSVLLNELFCLGKWIRGEVLKQTNQHATIIQHQSPTCFLPLSRPPGKGQNPGVSFLPATHARPLPTQIQGHLCLPRLQNKSHLWFHDKAFSALDLNPGAAAHPPWSTVCKNSKMSKDAIRLYLLLLVTVFALPPPLFLFFWLIMLLRFG